MVSQFLEDLFETIQYDETEEWRNEPLTEEDPDDEFPENSKSQNGNNQLLDIENQRVAYHEHEGWQEHPVRVKYHEKYFNSRQQNLTAHSKGQSELEDRIKKQIQNHPNKKISDMWNKAEKILWKFQTNKDVEEIIGNKKKFEETDSKLLSWEIGTYALKLLLRVTLHTLKNELEATYEQEKAFFTNSLPKHYKLSEHQFNKLFEHGKRDAENLIPYILKSRQMLAKKYADQDGYITVYRGIRGELAADIRKMLLEKKDVITIPNNGVSSFSLSLNVAKSFSFLNKPNLPIQKGVVLKKRIPISDVWLFFPAIVPHFKNELEILVDSDATKIFSQDEIITQ